MATSINSIPSETNQYDIESVEEEDDFEIVENTRLWEDDESSIIQDWWELSMTTKENDDIFLNLKDLNIIIFLIPFAQQKSI